MEERTDVVKLKRGELKPGMMFIIGEPKVDIAYWTVLSIMPHGRDNTKVMYMKMTSHKTFCIVNVVGKSSEYVWEMYRLAYCEV